MAAATAATAGPRVLIQSYVQLVADPLDLMLGQNLVVDGNTAKRHHATVLELAGVE